MNWYYWALTIPNSKSEILDKLDNDGYTYPHYSRRLNSAITLVDEMSLRRDCDRVGIRLSEVYPRQIELL